MKQIDREEFMLECWQQYQSTADVSWLIQAVEEAPFFGQREMALEISRRLKWAKSDETRKLNQASEEALVAMRGHSGEEKVKTSINLLRVVSEFLNKTVNGFDARPITYLIGEITDICRGNNPSFIKSTKKVVGRKKKIAEHLDQAALSACVMILVETGKFKKTTPAIKYLVQQYGVKFDKIRNALNRYQGHLIDEEVRTEAELWINQAVSSNQTSPENMIDALMLMVSKKG